MITLLAVVLCTNANWLHSDRCTAPIENIVFTEQGIEGTLTSGVRFTQNHIVPGLQRFDMEEVHWYTSDKGKIDADSNLQALSIYMTL